jgi:hypothetical protein
MQYPSVTVLEIPEQPGLDRINVYWHNVRPSQGYVTITCWGCAWTSWFGAMGDNTIETFFLHCGPDYLVNKLGITQWLKTTKQHEKYLERLIIAVQTALRAATPSA